MWAGRIHRPGELGLLGLVRLTGLAWLTDRGTFSVPGLGCDVLARSVDGPGDLLGCMESSIDRGTVYRLGLCLCIPQCSHGPGELSLGDSVVWQVTEQSMDRGTFYLRLLI